VRLGVFLPNWVGDVVMATPALRALRKHVGHDGGLVGVMRPYVADVLAGGNWFDETVLYDKRKPADRPELRIPAAIHRLRDARLDGIVLLTNSFRTAWMAWRSGVGQRIGYVGQLRSLLLTDRLPNPTRVVGNSPRVPSIDSYLRLAEAAGCAPETAQMELATTRADEEAADAVCQWLDLPVDGSVITLNPGAAYGVAKQWPIEYFASLARRIVEGHDCHVLVNCGPKERDLVREVVRRSADRRVVGLADIVDLPIGLTKAVIRRSRLLVTTDSGPRFFGIAFARPVVTLFGPTDPRMTDTRSALETQLFLSLDCQPCMARSCPLGHHRCMRELTVDRVYAAVVEGLSFARAAAQTGDAAEPPGFVRQTVDVA
jgi:heptosyltransferase-2